MTAAVVVFADRGDIWWLRLLRRGFRHCFVLVAVDGGWVLVDPLSHQTDLALVAPVDAADIARFYRAHGCAAVVTERRTAPRRMAPWRPYTCVEAVKRMLGIQAGWVMTPWALFKFLRAKGKNALT